MKFKEVAEWEDHRIEPGGDEVCLLEAVDVPTDSPRYTRIPWAEFSDGEFDALEQGKTIELKQPFELTHH